MALGVAVVVDDLRLLAGNGRRGGRRRCRRPRGAAGSRCPAGRECRGGVRGRGFTSPAAIYPWTLISYSYGKVLLSLGQRVGYLAISPPMSDAYRQALRDAVFATQMGLGWTVPNAVMQYAVPQREGLSIDVRALARRRDALTKAATPNGLLRASG